MTIDPRTIAAEIMTDYARDVGSMDIAAYVMSRNNGIISADLIDEVADLITETDVDLIWPDGTRQSKLDAAIAEIEQYREAARHYSALAAERNAKVDELTAELEKLRAELTLVTDQRDAARAMADELRDDLRAADDNNGFLQQHIADIRAEADR